MKKVGELLKSERERRGLSLHEIGMSLKINPKILQSIEEGNTAGLPAKTFLRGFIRSYAQYLRMDVEQVLNLLQQESGPVKSEDPQVPGATQAEISAPTKMERLSRKSEEPAIPRENKGFKIYTVVGAIVLLLAIGFVVRMIEKYQKESEVVQIENATPIEQPVEAMATPALSTPVDGSGESTTTTMLDSSTSSTLPLVAAVPTTVTSTSSTTLTTTTTLKPTTTTVTTTTRPTTTTTTTTLKATTTTVTSTTKPSTTTTTRPVTTTTKPPTTTTVPGALITTPTSTTTTLKAKAGPVEVIAEATGSVTVRYNLGEGSWNSIEMSAGQMHTFKGKSGVVLEISNGGALNVIVNGRDRGAAGSSGKATTVTYP